MTQTFLGRQLEALNSPKVDPGLAEEWKSLATNNPLKTTYLWSIAQLTSPNVEKIIGEILRTGNEATIWTDIVRYPAIVQNPNVRRLLTTPPVNLILNE